MTTVFDSYSEYCRLRMRAFYKKRQDNSYVDPDLDRIKYTNIYRILDTTSQYELKNILYNNDSEPFKTLFRTFLFIHYKTLNFGELLNYYPEFLDPNTFDKKQFIDICTPHKKLFTRAYLTPGKHKIVANRMEALIKIKNSIKIDSALDIFSNLKKLSGDFIASQTVYDLFWHKSFKSLKNIYCFSPQTKIAVEMFKYSSTTSENQIIRDLRSVLKRDKFSALKVGNDHIFPDVADLQNSLAEFEKYCRVKKGEKIKKLYKPDPNKVVENIYLPGFWICKDEDLIKLEDTLI